MGTLSTLVTALKAGNLVTALQGKGPFTVFAPANAAFAKLPKATLKSLLKPKNKGKLVDILTYHVVAGAAVYSKDLKSTQSVKTLQGQNVVVKKSSDGVTINGKSKVIAADIAATNGVVHVIDTVLMPTAGKNAEVKAVWSKLRKQNADAMNNWQKTWKVKGTPLYKDTKKKTVSSTATEFLFTFANKCVLKVKYDTIKQDFAIQSKNCPNQKCEDNESMSTAISAKFKVVGSNKCNQLYKIVSKYGFKCDSKLNEFGIKMSLKDACCKTYQQASACKLPNYRGDGNCDDENNNKDCGYDGGDCCAKTVKGEQVKKNYCKECKCVDPDNQGKGKLTCKLPNYKGDGNCDDANNNKGCAYDGGDCCAKTVKGGQVNKKYCKECKCVDPDNQGKGKLTCKLPNYKGDGNCDDENNNKGCGYDGGDCCAKTVKGGLVKKDFCKTCKCVDPDNQGKGKLICKLPNYRGDGNCDDENNNKGCGYDGGDCCAKTVTGGQVKTKYCKECKCIDPAGNN